MVPETVVLELNAAGFTYRGAAAATLTDIDLSLAPGQMHTVLGALGSGTSTLVRLITGLLGERGNATGDVWTDGTAVMLGDDPEAQLSGMTSLVADEVVLPGRLHGDEVSAVESRARLTLDSLGVGDLWGRRLDSLSGGQRQLVALAGLLTLRPSLLVLDQPALSLDPETRRRLGQVLQEFCSTGGAVLITAHQFDEVAAASHRLSILDSGRLLDVATRPSAGDLERHGIWDTLGSDHPEYGRPEAGESFSTRSAVINARRLTARGLNVVRGETAVISGIDLDLHSGQLLTIMGSNGAGKSTLLRGLAGLLEARARTSGTIAVDDHGTELRVGEAPAHDRANHLGWVGQDPGAQLSAATVRDELVHAAPLPPHRRRDRALVRAHRQEAVASAMVETQLTEANATHPYDLNIDRRKDLVMASALITGAPILLLDEPTLGRDHLAIKRLNIFIKGFLRRGGAILATTHDRKWAAETSGRALYLADGQLHEDQGTGGGPWRG